MNATTGEFDEELKVQNPKMPFNHENSCHQEFSTGNDYTL